MKKNNVLKRIKSFLLSGVIAITGFSFAALSASANDDLQGISVESRFIAQPIDDNGYTLIQEETYIDENGMRITHRSYVENINAAVPYDLTRNELSIYETTTLAPSNNSPDWVSIWIKGTFAYYPEAKSCLVKKASSGYNVLNGSATVVSTSQSYDSNQGGGLFGLGKKYGFIERKITLDNHCWKGKHDFRFRIEVNSSGKITRKY